ncbi:hypothetical protein LTR16_003945 [Cryomyces antarcticus]|uniref:Uncharacterized protein n=1 Tax=Cryomyces antarcticus TaxID=329879 RepID=A0ABR0LNI2_9PEZI|nr:hypothetical protein LTR16_003945 [Cryomyces antarcticus]
MTGGTIKSEEGFEPRLDAEFHGVGYDYIRQDPSGEYMRLDVRSQVKNHDGGLLALCYTGIIKITEGIGKVLAGADDAATVPYGDACKPAAPSSTPPPSPSPIPLPATTAPSAVPEDVTTRQHQACSARASFSQLQRPEQLTSSPTWAPPTTVTHLTFEVRPDFYSSSSSCPLLSHENLAQTGSEALRPLETMVFVSAGRFVVEKGEAPVVEYKVSRVVAGR